MKLYEGKDHIYFNHYLILIQNVMPGKWWTLSTSLLVPDKAGYEPKVPDSRLTQCWQEDGVEKQ